MDDRLKAFLAGAILALIFTRVQYQERLSTIRHNIKSISFYLKSAKIALQSSRVSDAEDALDTLEDYLLDAYDSTK